MDYKIVEVKNRFAIHAICDTLEGAEYILREQIPSNCARRIYDDKTLQPEDFMIIKEECVTANSRNVRKKRG